MATQKMSFEEYIKHNDKYHYECCYGTECVYVHELNELLEEYNKYLKDVAR